MLVIISSLYDLKAQQTIRLFTVQLEEFMFLHICRCITKHTEPGILSKPYINFKAIRIGGNLLPTQQTQTAVTL